MAWLLIVKRSLCRLQITSTALRDIGFVTCRVKDRPDIVEEVKFFAATPLIATNGYRLGSL